MQDARRKSFRLRGPTYNLIMEVSVGHPMLTPPQVAALVGRDQSLVTALMRSDEFLEHRAHLLLERYGDKIANVRHKLLDFADTILEALTRRMADSDEAPAQVILDAAKWIMPFVTAPVHDPNSKQALPTNPTVNIMNISAEALQSARQLQSERARLIDLPPHPTYTVPPLPPSLGHLHNEKEGEGV